MTHALDTAGPEEIIKALQELKASNGWELLTEMIRRNDMTEIGERLMRGEYRDINERNRDRDRYDIMKFFADEVLDVAIASINGAPEGADARDMDVFPQNEKEAIKAMSFENKEPE